MGVTLPNTLHELLTLALDDIERLGDGYQLDMGAWHMPYDGVCYVCMAGAIMAMTIEYPETMYVIPDHTDFDSKLRAVNRIRIGKLRGAWDLVHKVPAPVALDSVDVGYGFWDTPEPSDRGSWLAHWRRVASDLKEIEES